MSKSEPQKTRAETMKQTRQALIDAALELFAADGLEVSLDAICERAGFTRGALYVHFKDRSELILAVMEQVGNAFIATVFEQLETPGGEGQGRFEVVAERFVGAVEKGRYPLMGGVAGKTMIRPHQLLEACARSEIVREHYRSLVALSQQLVGGLIAEDQGHGALRADVDPNDAATIVIALVSGSQVLAELGIAIDAPRLKKTLLQLLVAT